MKGRHPAQSEGYETMTQGSSDIASQVKIENENSFGRLEKVESDQTLASILAKLLLAYPDRLVHVIALASNEILLLRRLESFGTKSLDVRNTFFRHYLVNT